jgi:hypothetical protein
MRSSVDPEARITFGGCDAEGGERARHRMDVVCGVKRKVSAKAAAGGSDGEGEGEEEGSRRVAAGIEKVMPWSTRS